MKQRAGVPQIKLPLSKLSASKSSYSVCKAFTTQPASQRLSMASKAGGSPIGGLTKPVTPKQMTRQLAQEARVEEMTNAKQSKRFLVVLQIPNKMDQVQLKSIMKEASDLLK